MSRIAARHVPRFTWTLAAAVLLLAAGCGGGSSTSTLTPAEQTKADLRLAQALVPQGSDLGSSWTPEPYTEHDVCASDNPDHNPKLVSTAHVGGVAYQHGDHPGVIGAATVFKTEAQAMTAYQLAVHHNPQCIARAFGKAARQSEGKHRQVTAVRLVKVALPTFGDESSDYRLVVAWNIYGHPMSNQMDIVLFRVGRGVAALLGVNENAPFDPQLLIRLASAIVQRGQSMVA